jgi:hypothetical protein
LRGIAQGALRFEECPVRSDLSIPSTVFRGVRGMDTLATLPTVSDPITDDETDEPEYHEDDEGEEDSVPAGIFLAVTLAQTKELREEACDEV